MSLNYTFCHSQNCVILWWAASDHLHFPHQQTKLLLSYLVAHMLVTDSGYSGHRPSDPFLPAQTLWFPSPSLGLFCSIPVLHQLCCITIFGFSSQPSSIVAWSLSRQCSCVFSRLSLSSLSLPWVTIPSALPQTSSGVQRSRGETRWRGTPWSDPD